MVLGLMASSAANSRTLGSFSPGSSAPAEHVLNAYAEAVRERYRFFSFGDAMCIL